MIKIKVKSSCMKCIFFFKQKTAYEMRISDWSSDVCSSDLAVGGGDDPHVGADRGAAADRGVFALLQHPPQPGLGLQRHVAELVQEPGAALRLLAAAGSPHGGAGARSLPVPQPHRLAQLARYPRPVAPSTRSLPPTTPARP